MPAQRKVQPIVRRKKTMKPWSMVTSDFCIDICSLLRCFAVKSPRAFGRGIDLSQADRRSGPAGLANAFDERIAQQRLFDDGNGSLLCARTQRGAGMADNE